MVVADELKADVDINKCIRCGKDKGFKGYRKEGLKHCPDCARELKDLEYLDAGSESVIKENTDRPKQVRVDYNEQETELDKILEEF